MAEQEDNVFHLPYHGVLDGLNLPTHWFQHMYENRIDDLKLDSKENFLLATYPRTGTTWTSQIMSLLLAGEEMYHAIKTIPLSHRVLFLEMTPLGAEEPFIKKIDGVPVPRALKTHLPYRFVRRWLMEDKIKTIVTTRNPKDTLVSMFHFYKNNKGYKFDGSWDDFFRHVQSGLQLYGDQYEWLKDWSDHMAQHMDQILVVKFEDMKADLIRQIKRIALFMGLHPSPALLDKIARDVNLDHMKEDPAVFTGQGDFKSGAKFIRQGAVGGWKNYFTVEQNEWHDGKYQKLYAELGIDVHYE